MNKKVSILFLVLLSIDIVYLLVRNYQEDNLLFTINILICSILILLLFLSILYNKFYGYTIHLIAFEVIVLSIIFPINREYVPYRYTNVTAIENIAKDEYFGNEVTKDGYNIKSYVKEKEEVLVLNLLYTKLTNEDENYDYVFITFGFNEDELKKFELECNTPDGTKYIIMDGHNFEFKPGNSYLLKLEFEKKTLIKNYFVLSTIYNNNTKDVLSLKPYMLFKKRKAIEFIKPGYYDGEVVPAIALLNKNIFYKHNNVNDFVDEITLGNKILTK